MRRWAYELILLTFCRHFVGCHRSTRVNPNICMSARGKTPRMLLLCHRKHFSLVRKLNAHTFTQGCSHPLSD